jgi:hypothetical protein
MAVGKSLRFEVFARDSFICQYCGRRPPEVVLECDHIHPRSKGGSDEIVNLVTSCYDCNQGKRAKIISEVAPRPDADIALLKVQQELAEVKQYLSGKRKHDAALKQVKTALRACWTECLDADLPEDRELSAWIKRYGPEEVEFAIRRVAPMCLGGRFRYEKDLKAYIGGIMRKRESEADGQG